MAGPGGAEEARKKAQEVCAFNRDDGDATTKHYAKTVRCERQRQKFKGAEKSVRWLLRGR